MTADDRPLNGLYALTPERPDRQALLQQLAAVLDGGVRLLQYRRKATPAEQRAQEAGDVLALCRRHGARLIVNDDVELAAAIGADGVHLGRDDGDITAARQRLGPTALIGASCYDALPLAERAVAAGADYVAFGSVYASGSKPQAPSAALATLTAARRLGRPVCAIGGITVARAPEVVAAGADLLAVIGGLFDCADPRQAAAAFCALFDRADHGGR